MSERIEVIGGPWPERIGCTGRTVDDPGDGIYPFDKRTRDEVIVLLDDDPLDSPNLEHQSPRGWSCAMRKSDVRFTGG